MLKKTLVLGLLSVAALTGFAMPSRAGEIQSQESAQITNQGATAVGGYNSIWQNSSQTTVQQQAGKFKNRKYCGHVGAQQQAAGQVTNQSAVANGFGNVIGQHNQQLTVQQQVQRMQRRSHDHHNVPCYDH